MKPVKLTEENFAPFGKYCNIKSEAKMDGGGYEEYMTVDNWVYCPMRFGMTVCEKWGSFDVDSMERHMTTEEILLCADRPIVLCVANSDPTGEPLSDDVRAFLMEPGDLVMMNKGIWHDACQAVADRSFYYFVAHGTGKGDEIVWHSVLPEPVHVTI